jgi:hypothetical protein
MVHRTGWGSTFMLRSPSPPWRDVSQRLIESLLRGWLQHDRPVWQAGWQVLPGHEPRLCEHSWYVVACMGSAEEVQLISRQAVCEELCAALVARPVG